MHYYKFNIADWAKDTSYLSLEEEAIYFRLINYYYDNEKPIPLETQSVFRRLRLGGHSKKADFVLQEFFTKTDEGWLHSRCEKLIDEYQKRAERNRKNGLKGGRKANQVETEKEPSGLQVETEKEPTLVNHKPLTTNQEPIKEIGVDNSTPKPKAPAVPYQDILEAYQEILVPVGMSNTLKLTDDRKRKIRTFWFKCKMDLDGWREYCEHIKNNCQWMHHDRPNGQGGFWKKKNLEYIATEKVFVEVVEGKK